jgi:hypothetical protein
MEQKLEQAQAPAVKTPQLLDDYLTREELAVELGKCVRTLDRWHAVRYGPPRATVGREPRSAASPCTSARR